MKFVLAKNRYLSSFSSNRFQSYGFFFVLLFFLAFNAYAFADYTWEEVPTGYGLAWSDEFNGAVGSAPNSANWTYDTGTDCCGNNELETYTTSTTNAQIIADPNAVDGKSLAIIALDPGGNNAVAGDYTSARVKSQNLQTFTYGYMEARVRMPYGDGIWPAFWMLGNDIGSVGWPACDEIDIMENIGNAGTYNGNPPDQANNHGSLHDGNNTTEIFTLPGGQLFHNEYHTYSALWQSNEIQFFCDGNLYETDTPATLGNTWAFNNNPNFFILNVAVGGSWPGNPDASTSFPQTMYVDYVRAYQTGFATPTPVVQSTWRVHCGGDNYTDGNGNLWVADTNFTGGWPSEGGSAPSGTVQPTSGDSSLYQWQRYGNTTGGETVTYTFNVPNGNYQVDLKFDETYWTAAGQRQFNYSINGTTEQTNFDIFATAGGANKALDEIYNNITPNGSGQIVIQFTQGAYDNPSVGGIQIISNGPTATPTKTFTPTPTFTPAPPTATPTNTPACGTLVANFASGTTQDNLAGYITLSYGGTGCTTTANPNPWLPTAGDGTGGSGYGANFNGTIGTTGCYGPSLLLALGAGTPSYNAQAAGQNAETFQIDILTGPASGPATVYVGVIPTNGTSSGFQYPLVIPASSFNTNVSETVYFSQMAWSYGSVTTLNTAGLYQLYFEPAWTGNYNLTVNQIYFTCAPALTPTPTMTNTFTSTNSLTPTSTVTSTLTNTPTATITSTYTLTNTLSPTVTSTFTSTLTNTPAQTRTFTSTQTNTFTSTATSTITLSLTPTLTPTATVTSTVTLSYTPTNTPVGSWTAVDTATPTNTNSSTASYTPSLTATSTLSYTSTSTVTNTVTNTVTQTPAAPTATFTNTFTPSATTTNTFTHTPAAATSTFTLTLTPSATVTSTFTATRTATASFTATSSATNTGTSTVTSTLTATPTLTYTLTASPSATATNTSTTTPVPTATRTFTASPTSSATVTNTPTIGGCAGIPNWNGNFVAYSVGQKVDYNGEVYQCIQAHTSEPNWEPPVVPALWKDMGPCGATATASLSEQAPVVYPNPVTSSTANLQLPVSNATNVKVQIFTLAFREVQTITAAQVSGNSMTISMIDKSGISLADGLYYFVIQANGQKWVDKILILR